MAAIIVGGALVMLFILLFAYISNNVCNTERFGERNTYRIQKKDDKYWIQVFSADCDYSNGSCWVYISDKPFDTHDAAEAEVKRLVSIDRSRIV